MFNALHHVFRGGIAERMLPNNLPPWHAVYQQTQRWMKAVVFEALVHDLREVLRVTNGA
ncbi:MAG: transposase [Actinobacteria bacterium]|nr:transposase [Actinomycetota bacterium]